MDVFPCKTDKMHLSLSHTRAQTHTHMLNEQSGLVDTTSSLHSFHQQSESSQLQMPVCGFRLGLKVVSQG